MSEQLPDHMLAVPRTLIVDLAVRFGGASARALGVLCGMPAGCAALACLQGTAVEDRARALGLEVYPVASSKLDPRLLARLVAVIRGSGFEVVDTQNSQSKLWGSLAAMQTGAALVSTLNSWYENELQGSLKGRLYQRLEHITTRRTDMFIAVAPDIYDLVLRSGVSSDRVALILNAVEIDPDRIDANGAWLRQRIGLPAETRTAATVGRFVPAKGYEHLIRALSLIAARYPDLHLVMVGDGELRDSITAQIAQANLQDRVHLLGFLPPDEVLKIVKASDFFLMPSVTEGTPIALLEGGALGKPMIASRVGGIPDILTDGETGLLTPPADAGALAAALARLLDDPGLARCLSQSVQSHIQRSFSRKAQVAATIRAYQTALERRRLSS